MFITASCSNKKQFKVEKVLTKAEKEVIQLENAEYELRYSKEKIALLSAIKGVHYDTLYSILKDYYYNLDGNNDNDTLVRNAILYTAEKHVSSKSKIASCIFSFKYEMLTKDEIMGNDISVYTRQKIKSSIGEND